MIVHTKNGKYYGAAEIVENLEIEGVLVRKWIGIAAIKEFNTFKEAVRFAKNYPKEGMRPIKTRIKIGDNLEYELIPGMMFMVGSKVLEIFETYNTFET